MSRERTRAEEIANGATHAIGAVLSVAGLTLLTVFASQRGDAWHIVSCCIYGATLIVLFSASSIYHFASTSRTHEALQVFDHASIYLLIAGTYTPFTLVPLRGPWGWTLFGLIWGLALVGVSGELFVRRHVRMICVPVYLLMGYLILMALRPLLQHVPLGGVVWLVVGGALYSLGVLFYAWTRLPFAHTVWHGFVLAASICHFFSIMWYVIPPAG